MKWEWTGNEMEYISSPKAETRGSPVQVWAFIIQATMSRLPNVEEPSSKLHTKIFYKNQMFDCFKTTPPLHRDHLKQNGYSHIRIKHNSLTLLLVLITWIERINGRYSAFVKANIDFFINIEVHFRSAYRARKKWMSHCRQVFFTNSYLFSFLI